MAKGTMYTVHTDVDPNLLGDLAKAVYKEWVSWAVGKESLGGKTLRAPSGRYAAGIQMAQTGDDVVEIWVDEADVPYAAALEYGRPEIMMRNALLFGAKSANAKTSKEGYKYKVVNIKTDTAYGSMLKSSMAPTSFSKIAAQIHQLRSEEGTMRTVSSKPGSSSWVTPNMSPYAPALILSKLVKTQYGANK